ncbi:unnamed protein product, partial [Pelagomonas calceolata]
RPARARAPRSTWPLRECARARARARKFASRATPSTAPPARSSGRRASKVTSWACGPGAAMIDCGSDFVIRAGPRGDLLRVVSASASGPVRPSDGLYLRFSTQERHRGLLPRRGHESGLPLARGLERLVAGGLAARRVLFSASAASRAQHARVSGNGGGLTALGFGVLKARANGFLVTDDNGNQLYTFSVTSENASTDKSHKKNGTYASPQAAAAAYDVVARRDTPRVVSFSPPALIRSSQS